jgi:hypothetical protein
VTPKTDTEWARIAEETLSEIEATPDEEIAARIVATPELREVADAADAMAAAEARLREAVALARASGWSWNRIAVSLGTSRQAARQRFEPRKPPAKKATAAKKKALTARRDAPAKKVPAARAATSSTPAASGRSTAARRAIRTID